MVTILAAVLATALAVVDDVDDRVQVIEGMHQRGLHELVIDEAREFLDRYDGHAKAPRVRYRLADALFSLGRPDEAVAHDRQLVQQRDFPWRGESALRLGQCELAAGRLPEARQALTIARESGSDYLHAPAAFLLGEAAFREEAFDVAAQHYADVLRQQPDADTARDARAAAAWCALRLERHDEAVARAGEVLGLDPLAELAREMRFVRAEARLAAGSPRPALDDYAAIDGGPFADAALRGAGFALVALGDAEAAVRAFQTHLQRHPGSSARGEVALQLGVQQLLLGDARAADATLSSDAVPDDAAGRYWRARARADLGDSTAALALLDRADQAQPDDALRGHIATLRGDLLAASGRTAEAAEAYARGGSSEALAAAAIARLNAGDHAGALEQLDALLGDGSTDGTLLLARAESLFGLERWSEATAAFVTAAPHVAADQRLRVASRHAWSLYLSGDVPAAAAAFGRVARDHAGTAEGQEALGMQARAADESGDSQTAVAAWSQYVQRHPDGPRHAEGLLTLGRLQGGRARVDALQRLVDEHADDPSVPAALQALGDAHTEAGDARAAGEAYARLVDQHPLAEQVPAARAALAWALVDLGQIGAAAQVLDVLVAPQPAPRRGQPAPAQPTQEELRDGLELLVWCRQQLGEPDAAEAAFRRLASDDDDARVLESARTVVTAWTAAGQPERALALLQGLASRPSLAGAVHLEAGWVALDAAQLDAARQHTEAALARTPRESPAAADVAELAFFVAEGLWSAGDAAASLPLYTAASTPGAPRRAEALYKRGFLRLQADELPAAEAAFVALTADHADSPLHGEALFLLGETRFRAGDLEGALAPLRQVLSDHRGHAVSAKTRFRLGLALAQLERWREAEPVLDDLARLHTDFPNRLEAELWRGRSLAAQGNDRQARSALGRVVAEDGGVLSARARIELGRLDMAAGATHEALGEFLKVAVLYAHDAEVAEALVLAGQCLETQGDAARAADRYREVLDQHPEAPAAQTARARLDHLTSTLGKG